LTISYSARPRATHRVCSQPAWSDPRDDLSLTSAEVEGDRRLPMETGPGVSCLYPELRRPALPHPPPLQSAGAVPHADDGAVAWVESPAPELLIATIRAGRVDVGTARTRWSCKEGAMHIVAVGLLASGVVACGGDAAVSRRPPSRSVDWEPQAPRLDDTPQISVFQRESQAPRVDATLQISADAALAEARPFIQGGTAPEVTLSRFSWGAVIDRLAWVVRSTGVPSVPAGPGPPPGTTPRPVQSIPGKVTATVDAATGQILRVVVEAGPQ